MGEQKKVLFITSGIFPFVPKSDQSLFIRNLLQGISAKGAEVRTFMPKYGIISERKYQLHEVVRFSGTNLMIDDEHFLFIKVASLPLSRLQVYFVYNEEFFKRKYLFHDEGGKEFLDNDERSVFFVRGVIEIIKRLRWAPDIIHCHGWVASLVPFLIRKHYADPCFKNVRFVYSIYNDGLKQSFSNLLMKKLQRRKIFTSDMEYFNHPLHYESLTKLAVDFSDGILIQKNHPLLPSLETSLNEKKSIFLLPSILSDLVEVDLIDNFYSQLLS